MIIIDGKAIASRIKEDLKKEIVKLRENENIVPGLAVIMLGNDPASEIYIKNKVKACDQLEIYSEIIRLSEDASQIELLETIQELNLDPKISGILVQAPLPSHINEKEIFAAIKPKKDVDGLHPLNVGKMYLGTPEFIPCTPQGIMYLFKETGIQISGQQCVVIGRSDLVGKPISMLMLQENATVTICHSKTTGIEGIIKRADIIIVAVGKPNFLKGYMIKQGAVVIDVGINRTENGKVVGDVDFESVSKLSGFITPVPNGVGPMTIAMLMKNTVKAAKMNNSPYINIHE